MAKTKLDAIKKHLIEQVNKMTEEDIVERHDEVLVIDYFHIKLGNSKLIIPEARIFATQGETS